MYAIGNWDHQLTLYYKYGIGNCITSMGQGTRTINLHCIISMGYRTETVNRQFIIIMG